MLESRKHSQVIYRTNQRRQERRLRTISWLAYLEGGCGGVDEVLRLLLHPLLVVKLDVLLVLPAAAVRLPDGRRVVRQVRVAVVAKVFRHLDYSTF